MRLTKARPNLVPGWLPEPSRTRLLVEGVLRSRDYWMLRYWEVYSRPKQAYHVRASCTVERFTCASTLARAARELRGRRAIDRLCGGVG